MSSVFPKFLKADEVFTADKHILSVKTIKSIINFKTNLSPYVNFQEYLIVFEKYKCIFSCATS